MNLPRSLSAWTLALLLQLLPFPCQIPLTLPAVAYIPPMPALESTIFEETLLETLECSKALEQ